MLRLSLLLVLLSLGGSLWASPPLNPKYREFSSENGRYVLSVAPTGYRNCELSFHSFESNAATRSLIWSKKLDFCPRQVRVGKEGRHVVLFDRWRGGIHPKGLVGFNDRGELVASVPVATLLDQEEIRHSLRRIAGKGFFSWLSLVRELRIGTKSVHVVLKDDRRIEVLLKPGTTRPKP